MHFPLMLDIGMPNSKGIARACLGPDIGLTYGDSADLHPNVKNAILASSAIAGLRCREIGPDPGLLAQFPRGRGEPAIAAA